MSNKQVIDPICVISALLFVVTNSMDIASKFTFMDRRQGKWELHKSLDVSYLKDEWDHRHRNSAFETVTGLLGAVAWFSLCIPIIETSWFLSRGGKKRTGSHAFVCILAIGASSIELIAKLMYVGMSDTQEFIATNFALDDWDGWKTLEIVHSVVYGVLIWIDAFEYFAMFLIMSLIGLSVWKENREGDGSFIFDKKWAGFGFLIGLVSILEFSAAVLRFVSWKLFSKMVLYLSIFNSVIALPIWLLLLGLQLPVVRRGFEISTEVSLSSQPADSVKANEPPSGTFELTENNFKSDVVSGGELS